MSERGEIVFLDSNGLEFSLPVNEDGSCGPLPRTGVALRWEPPTIKAGSVRFRDAQSAAVFADALHSMGYAVVTFTRVGE